MTKQVKRKRIRGCNLCEVRRKSGQAYECMVCLAVSKGKRKP